MFCEGKKSFSSKHNTFAENANVLWQNAKFLSGKIILQENTNVLWENAKLWGNARERKCFARKCIVSQGNTIILQNNTNVLCENANILWANTASEEDVFLLRENAYGLQEMQRF